MLSILLITLLILLYSFQTLFCKLYADNYPGKHELSTPVFCLLESIAIAVISFGFAGFKFEMSPITLILGIANGIVLFVYNTSVIGAGDRGSYAFMNVAMLFGGILIPMIYSTVMGDSALTLPKYIAIGTMLFACLLMNIESIKLSGTKFSYYIFCLLLFLSNGAYGTLLKIQSSANENQSQEMVIITYAIMGVIAFIQLFAKEKKDTLKAFKFNAKSLIFLLLCLLSAGFAINMLVILIPLIDVAVLYTVDNGGVLMLSAIYSMLFFKEKPSLPKIIGIIIAVISLVVLSANI